MALNCARRQVGKLVPHSPVRFTSIGSGSAVVRGAAGEQVHVSFAVRGAAPCEARVPDH